MPEQSSFIENNMTRTYKIEGMHCQSCVKKINDALTGLAETIQITAIPPRVILIGKNIAELNILNKAVANIGRYTLKTIETAPAISTPDKTKSYYPLFLIFSMIFVVSMKGADNWHIAMMHFMAGFFIVFSFFKLLDLKGFKDAYSGYDLLAKRWPAYGFIYPFFELGLGLAFLFSFQLTAALWFSMALMGFSSLGVIKALREKRKIRCACLGTVLNLPMSTITLVEDLGMIVMAGMMLITL